jgi:hypothetical protein
VSLPDRAAYPPARYTGGGGEVSAHAGDDIHVPAGGIHGFTHRADGPASMLLHFAPGAPREAYCEGLARLAAGETMTDAERDTFMREHDNLCL